MPGSDAVKLDVPACLSRRSPRVATAATPMEKAGVWQGLTSFPEWVSPPASTRNLLGINAGVYPSRPRGMRHRLPHARRMRGRMLLLLLPLRAFGHGGTFKFIDRGIP